MPKLDTIGILILVDKVALVLAKQRGTIMGREMYILVTIIKEEK